VWTWSGVLASPPWNMAQASAPLPLFLTLDAVPSPRNGFEPLQLYVAAAFAALAESPLPHPLQSLDEIL